MRDKENKEDKINKEDRINKEDKANKKIHIKSIGVSAVMIVLFIIIVAFFQALLMPKYMTDSVEGALTEEYYSEKTEHQVVCIGDCEVYESIIPVKLWEEYGMTCYVRGSAQQLIWQSYYMLEDTLRYEKPDIVVFNVLSMIYDEPQNEAYNRMTLDGMKWSSSKINAVKASMTEDEKFIEYVFPLLRFHSRWNKLIDEDFKYLFRKDKVSYNGYVLNTGIKPVTTYPREEKLANYEFSDICYEYLDKIRNLCEKNGIKLVLMKAPSIYPFWYDEWENQINEYAQKNGLLYLNFLKMQDKTQIDYNTDTYDGGLHLNVWGAEKLTNCLGFELKQHYDIADLRENEKIEQVWSEKEKIFQDNLYKIIN